MATKTWLQKVATVDLPKSKIESILERDRREAARTVILNLRVEETRGQWMISEKTTVQGMLEEESRAALVAKLRRNLDLLLQKAGLISHVEH